MEYNRIIHQLQDLHVLDLDEAVCHLCQQIKDVATGDSICSNKTVEQLADLSLLINSAKNPLSKKTCTTILYEISVPILKHIHLSFDNRRENVFILGQINKLLTSCLYHDNDDSFKSIFELCEHSLQSHINLKSCSIDTHTLEGVLDLHVCLDVLLNVTHKKDTAAYSVFEMKSYRDRCNDIFSKFLCILNTFENQTILNLALRCISNMIKHGKEPEYLLRCWDLIKSMWISKRQAEILNIYLCGLSNFFFPVDNIDNVNIRNDLIFWEIVQVGLNSKNPLTRKQSLYLIKRNIDLCEKFGTDVNVSFNMEDMPLFWWCKEKQKIIVKVWEDLILLLETFEEKQIHVIKPLLPRLQTLLKAACRNYAEKPILHTSWLSVVFKRGISHESITLVKWMTEQVLYLDFNICPIIEQREHKYLTSEFLQSVQDPRIFARPQNGVRGSLPTCGDGLIHFFQNCWKALKTDEKRGNFFGQVLETLSTSNWGPVPLLFICQALSCVPESKILNIPSLFCLRKLITTQVATVGPFMRGAIQSFCVKILIALTQTSSVAPKQFAVVLAVFETEDALARGTTLWLECVQMFKSVCKEPDCDSWSKDSINKYLISSINALLQVSSDNVVSHSDLDIIQISRLLVLAVDSDILPITVEPGVNEPCLTDIMATLSSIIVSIPNHPYMPHQKAEQALEIIITVLDECRNSEDDILYQLVKKHIQECIGSLLLFTTQMILENWTEMSHVKSIELFINGLAKFLQCSKISLVEQQLLKLINTCIKILTDSSNTAVVKTDTQMRKIASMGILSSISSVLDDDHLNFAERICSFKRQYNCTTAFDKPFTDISHKEWGKIASMYISYQWIVMKYYFVHTDEMETPIVPVVKLCQDSLSVCSGHNTIPVYRCLGLLISKCKIPKDSSSIIEALSVSWSHVLGETKTSCFWQVLEEFITMTFQPALLQCKIDSNLKDVVCKYAQDLMVLGAEKTGVANLLLKRLCTLWKHSLESTDGFFSIIVHAAMYGNIFRKQDRHLNDVFAYIESLGKSCSVNELKPHTTKDIMVRVEIVSLICGLNPVIKKHQEFAVNLMKEVIRQYHSAHEESRTPGTITNSLVHRQKHRLLQIVVLLEPFIVHTNFQLLWTFVWDLLSQECQPSIRHTCEWIIMKIIIQKTDTIDELWKIFDKLTEKKSTVLCSIMCMVSHLGVHIPTEDQGTFYNTSFKKLSPWCMANHFNTRVHAAATMLKQWKQCEMLGLTEVMTLHSVEYSCLTFHKEPNNYTKNIQKLMENFFFHSFDPVGDYSLETLFYSLPWLFIIPDDEWIFPEQFCDLISNSNTYIPVYNSNQTLKKAVPGSWRYKNPGGTIEDSDEEDNLEGDVQKKIMPWKLMLPDEEVQEELEYSNRKKKEGGLIVVTSLIDRIPNLGGLCRSSEIFGVSQFVIRRMKFMDDKLFKDLSVTAQKWLPIVEVWEEHLPQYLTEKQQEGYTLIGVEQTANSVSLTDYVFPKKSLLLLGNEKEGIPVQLINQLDVCVEIPQQGIIRSLNVHVSGALLIWEYRRQQIVGQISSS